MPECRQAKVTRVPLVVDGRPDSFLPPICTSSLPSSSLPHFPSLLLSSLSFSLPLPLASFSVTPSSPLLSSFSSSLIPSSLPSIASLSLPLSSFPFSLFSSLHPFLPSFSRPLFLSSSLSLLIPLSLPIFLFIHEFMPRAGIHHSVTCLRQSTLLESSGLSGGTRLSQAVAFTSSEGRRPPSEYQGLFVSALDPGLTCQIYILPLEKDPSQSHTFPEKLLDNTRGLESRTSLQQLLCWGPSPTSTQVVRTLHQGKPAFKLCKQSL